MRGDSKASADLEGEDCRKGHHSGAPSLQRRGEGNDGVEQRIERRIEAAGRRQYCVDRCDQRQRNLDVGKDRRKGQERRHPLRSRAGRSKTKTTYQDDRQENQHTREEQGLELGGRDVGSERARIDVAGSNAHTRRKTGECAPQDPQRASEQAGLHSPALDR